MSDVQNKTTEEENKNEENQSTEENDLVITIGEETLPEEKETPKWVTETRRNNRELKKKVRALEAKLDEKSGPEIGKPGEKPTYKSCEFDEDRYDQDLSNWHEKKRKYDENLSKRESDKKRETESWNEKLGGYNEKKTALAPKLKNFDEIESITRDALNEVQQGLIVEVAENAPLVVYALGANPELLDKFSKIKSHPRFVAEMVKLEATLKMEKRKPDTKPEGKVESQGGTSLSSDDSQLEKLRAEAEKTGDYSEVTAYKNKMREKK